MNVPLPATPALSTVRSPSRGSPDPVISVRFYRAGLWTVAEITGELDVQSAPRMGDLVSCAGPWIVMDLGGVTFVDCRGLAQLVAGQVDARSAGGAARLANVSPMARRLIGLLELDGALAMFDTLEDALSAPVAGRAPSVAVSARAADLRLR